MLDDEFIKECESTHKQRRKSRPEGKRVRCLRSLENQLKKHGGLTAKGTKVCSKGTRSSRRKELRAFINLLHNKLGYPIEHVRGLKPKHIQAAFRYWEAEGHVPGTLQGKLSHIRVLCKWIDKPGMVDKLETYLIDPARAKRKYATEKLQGPEQNGIDVRPRLKVVLEEEPAMLVQMLLAYAFGLRIKEGMIMCPHLADQGGYIDVYRGAKGGRKRTVKITSDLQRSVLDLAKKFADTTSSTTPKNYTLRRWLNRWKTVVATKAGLNKKNGCNPHKLRHGYAATIYESITGHPPPVSGQVRPEDVDPEKDRLARQQVAEDLGHSRIKASSAYIGAMGDCDFSDAPIKKQENDEGNDEQTVDEKEHTNPSGDDDT